MIVKDEEEFLEACLASASGLVDEMVVYDTGSTDGTVALARSLGARVIEGTWHDDFGRARNAALEECRGEWILHLDADEVATFDRDRLRTGLRNARDLDALLVEIRNIGEDGAVTFHHVNRRLFRRERAHWVGRLHERVESRTGRPLREARLDGVAIDHFGYTPALLEARGKRERNIRIAEAEFAAASDADRAVLGLNLARAHSGAGRWDDAVEVASTVRAMTGIDDEVRRLVLRVGIEALIEAGRLHDAVEWVEAFRAAGGAHDLAEYLQGTIDLFGGGDGRRLAELGDVADVIDADGISVPTATLTLRTALAQYAEGRYGAAAERFDALLTERPDLQLWGRLATCVVESLGDVDAFVASIPEASLRTVMAQVLLEPVHVGEVVGVALRSVHEDDPRLAAYAVHHAKRLDDLEAVIAWATLVRNAELPEHCPLLAFAEDVSRPAAERFMAAVAGHAAFADERARRLLDQLVDQLRPEDEPLAIHTLQELAPELIVSES